MVWSNEEFTCTEKYFVTLLSRNFCQNYVRVNFRYFVKLIYMKLYLLVSECNSVDFTEIWPNFLRRCNSWYILCLISKVFQTIHSISVIYFSLFFKRFLLLQSIVNIFYFTLKPWNFQELLYLQHHLFQVPRSPKMLLVFVNIQQLHWPLAELTFAPYLLTRLSSVWFSLSVIEKSK